MTSPRVRLTIDDYMATPDDQRYQLLDGELVLAPSPITKHQWIVVRLLVALHQFVTAQELGTTFIAPYDAVLSQHDVAQPDILFVSNARAAIITEANIQGAPDLVVEILSPGTARYDRGYKRDLYSRHNVLEYWLVDPATETVEVLTQGDTGLTVAAVNRRADTLTSPLLAGLDIDLEGVFRE